MVAPADEAYRTSEYYREGYDMGYVTRVMADRLRPVFGNLPPLLAKTVDVEELVAAWSQLRARLRPEAPHPCPAPDAAARSGRWRGLLRWLRRRT